MGIKKKEGFMTEAEKNKQEECSKVSRAFFEAKFNEFSLRQCFGCVANCCPSPAGTSGLVFSCELRDKMEKKSCPFLVMGTATSI